jgi:hypothetical protein
MSIDVCADWICVINIVLTFFTSYYNVDEELITDKKAIALNYFRSWFAIDLISIVPMLFEIIPNYPENHQLAFSFIKTLMYEIT